MRVENLPVLYQNAAEVAIKLWLLYKSSVLEYFPLNSSLQQCAAQNNKVLKRLMNINEQKCTRNLNKIVSLGTH